MLPAFRVPFSARCRTDRDRFKLTLSSFRNSHHCTMGKRKLVAQRDESEDDDSVEEESEEELSEEEQEEEEQPQSSKPRSGKLDSSAPGGTHSTKYVNKQRSLIIASRGISHRDRHLMSDLRDLMPHAKKDAKFDSKERLVMLNESAEMKNCNNCIYFEARKHQDLYMWLAKCPNGPSIKFLVNNIHTMEEMKLTGNCLKGSRPIMSFDKSFDTEPHYKLFKEMILQIFGTPRNQPRSKPFIDHVFSWFIVDNRIWFRNYQIVYDDATKAKNAGAPVLVEVGPRFVLCPIKVFSGSFQGTTLYENPDYVSPNSTRAEAKKLKSGKYSDKVDSKEWQQIKRADAVLPPDVLADIFVDDNQDE